ncbi:MAG: Spx/MgsR family RNA polymerase-binding regulatory protein [Myxococcales bacterium]|nr:Spx/MgsR family RNA polymerase-binding regulatory protein [Myxococcales bacterium]
MIRMYGYAKCGTCRNAKKLLAQWELPFEEIDITTDPPPKSLLKALLGEGGYSIGQLFNRSGQEYRKLGLKDRVKTMSQAEALELLAGNGRLIKRPIVSDGTRMTVGLDAERFEAVWGC